MRLLAIVALVAGCTLDRRSAFVELSSEHHVDGTEAGFSTVFDEIS